MPRGTKTAPGSLELRAAGLIRAELERQGQTIQWLADAVGLSRPQVSKVLSGQKPVTLTEIETMCAALGLDMLEVIRRSQQP